MADFLEQKRREIDERIVELRPTVDEFRRLEAALAALGGIARNGAGATTRSVRKRGPGRPRRSSRARAVTATTASTAAKRAGRPRGGGKRSRQALEAVGKQPGITIAELAIRMGIKQNYLYRVMPALEQEGKVRKQGHGWHPAT